VGRKERKDRELGEEMVCVSKKGERRGRKKRKEREKEREREREGERERE
jgi:hypothetical protein